MLSVPAASPFQGLRLALKGARSVGVSRFLLWRLRLCSPQRLLCLFVTYLLCLFMTCLICLFMTRLTCLFMTHLICLSWWLPLSLRRPLLAQSRQLLQWFLWRPSSPLHRPSSLLQLCLRQLRCLQIRTHPRPTCLLPPLQLQPSCWTHLCLQLHLRSRLRLQLRPTSRLCLQLRPTSRLRPSLLRLRLRGLCLLLHPRLLELYLLLCQRPRLYLHPRRFALHHCITSLLLP